MHRNDAPHASNLINIFNYQYITYWHAICNILVKHHERRLPMEKLVKLFEDVMVAVTFAEAGEFDEANKIAGNTIEHDQKGSVPAVAER
jgi:hypothetical protein